MKHQSVCIGDVLPWNPLPPVCEGGKPLWFGPRVIPQAEPLAVEWLRRHVDGAYSFYPVTVARKPVRGAVKFVNYERRYLPGYVFTRFRGEPQWHRLFERCPFIHDVIRYRDGRPAAIDPRSLGKLHAMRSRDQEITELRRASRTIRKGDRVRFEVGGIDHDDIEVIEIKGPTAKVRLGLLGRGEIEVPIDAMEKCCNGTAG